MVFLPYDILFIFSIHGRRNIGGQCQFILERLLGSKKDSKCCLGNTKVTYIGL